MPLRVTCPVTGAIDTGVDAAEEIMETWEKLLALDHEAPIVSPSVCKGTGKSEDVNKGESERDLQGQEQGQEEGQGQGCTEIQGQEQGQDEGQGQGCTEIQGQEQGQDEGQGQGCIEIQGQEQDEGNALACAGTTTVCAIPNVRCLNVQS